YDHLGQGLQSRFRAFFPVSTGGTNVGLAIRNGIMKLADAPGGAEAEASIIMVSDFITTCFNGTADGADPLGGLVTEPPESASPFCGRQAEYYLRAQQELTNIVREYLVPQKIRVHAAIVGSHVAPHNLLVRGAQGCMDSREARLAHPNEYVDTPSTGNPQDELDDMYRTPFVRANEFYSRVVAPTNGLWMPLRPPCGAAGSTALTDLRNAVSSACQNDNLQVGDRLDSVDGAIGELQSNISALGFNPAQVVDSSGRLLCDLEGRGMDQQMREYMDTIMRDNTLYLVG
ncbi:MAG: hypothetical protein DCC75_10685, partial [Proteobacteria bacterium]